MVETGDGVVSVRADRDVASLGIRQNETVVIALGTASAPALEARLVADIVDSDSGLQVTGPEAVVSAPAGEVGPPADGVGFFDDEGRGGRTCQDLVTNPCGARISGT